MKKNNLKKQSGITIIALVITIIVLLILAGISIYVVSNNGTFDTADKSRILTELSQLSELINQEKIDAQKDSIQNGIYSDSLSNDILIEKNVIVNELTVSGSSIKLGLIDPSTLKFNTSIGNSFSNYTSTSNVSKMTDLKDVFAINLETNDIYYIKDKIYTINGTVEENDLLNPSVSTDGPTISVNMNISTELNFSITVSKGSDNVELKDNSVFEYCLSTEASSIVGGNWSSYVSGKEITLEKRGVRVYYLFVKSVENINGTMSKAVGDNAREVLVSGQKYHRFGPYNLDNSIMLEIDPNGGKYKNSSSITTIKGKLGGSIILNNNDITPPKGYTVSFDANGGNVSEKTIGSTTSFTNWTLSGKGTLSKNIFTFGTGTGTIVANYKQNEITLPTPTRTGYTFDGWYIDATSDDKIGNGGDKYTPTSDITLFAKWTPNNYTITYDNNNYVSGLDNIGSTVSTRITYSVSNKVVTVTANSDDGYGYINCVAYLEAGKKYIFNCTTNGKWGGNNADTVEAFLMLNSSTSTSYFHLSSNSNFEFTAPMSGVYTLRLDVNKAGKTYTFSNISITEPASSQNKVYGTTLGTLPTPSRPFFTFNGWYTSPTGGTQVNSSTSVPSSDTTYYAHWVDQGNSSQIANITSNGYDVYMHTSNISVTSAKVPTWTDYNGQDDLLQPWENHYLATKLPANYYHFRVNTLEHNSESGKYHSHIYAYNSSGGQAFTITHNDIMVPASPISISFNQNGNTTYAKAHSTKVTASSSAGSISILKYAWIEGTRKLTQLSDFNIGATFTNGTAVNGSGVNGDWYLWIYAQDTSGNAKIARSNVFKYDNTAPTVPKIEYNGGDNTHSWKNNYNLTLKSSDSHSGVSYYQQDTNNDGNPDGNVNSNFIPWNGYSSCNARFRAVDKAGNISGWTSPIHIHMDTEAPSKTTVNLNGYASGSWTAGNVTQTASATDNIGIAYYEYSHNESSVAGTFPNPWTISWDGYWNFYVRAVDHAGNKGAWSNMYTINRSVYQINNSTGVTYASTLAAAVNASQNGATIYLLKNFTDSSGVSISKNITINPNGWTLARTAQTTINGGYSVTVGGSGYFKTNSNIILLHNSGTLTVSTNTDSSTSHCNIYNNGTVTITTGGHSNAHNNTTNEEFSGSVLGNIGTANITGGAFSKSGTTGRVIYNHSTGNLTISNASITATDTGRWTALKNMGSCTINSGANLSSNQANTIGSEENSSLTMNGGKVSSSSSYGYGQAIVCRGTTKIFGGDVVQTATSGDVPAIRGEDLGKGIGNLVIGNKDAALNTSNPLITSHGGRAILHDGTLKFNNGKLRGKTNPPYHASKVNKRDGCSINTTYNKNNGFYLSTLK